MTNATPAGETQERFACGCITCVCEDPFQCHGCGATRCKKPDVECDWLNRPRPTTPAGEREAHSWVRYAAKEIWDQQDDNGLPIWQLEEIICRHAPAPREQEAEREASAVLAALREEIENLARYGDRPGYATRIRSLVDELVLAQGCRPTPAPAEGGWQPIATAPKDGTQIFVARDMGPHGWILGTAHWREVAGLSGWFSWGIAGGSELGLAHPTHWMPLPQPPKEGS